MLLIKKALANFESLNRPHVSRLTRLLDAICVSDELHPLFLNTLSMLEHIGSRKIMITQARGDMDQPTLKHLADETRHAFFMKRQAEKASRRTMAYGTEDVLAQPAARMYFQRLELGMRQTFAVPTAAIYLYMSMIIEFRATWGYRIFQDALERHARDLPLKSLLAEEKQHLGDMAERLDKMGALSSDYIEDFSRRETAGFERLLSALEADFRVQNAGKKEHQRFVA